jgi:hypothetical protein
VRLAASDLDCLAARYYSQYRAYSRRQFAITLRLGEREMSSWSPEDAIAMERRHVSEGEERIARQEALAAESTHKGHDQLAIAVNELLVLMRASLELSRMRLRQLEGRNGATSGDGI